MHDLRDWTTDRHRTVDDTPFGGGAGMVMRPDVWGTALDERARRRARTCWCRRRRGSRSRSAPPRRSPASAHLVLACGRYEGIDARVAEHYRAPPASTCTEFSLGDYVLNGGEVAALVVVEAVARLLPGVVGNPESLVEESHGAAGLLEYPVYTKPPAWAGLEVPDVLLSGHHARIARWRRDTALRADGRASARPHRGAARRRAGRARPRACSPTLGWRARATGGLARARGQLRLPWRARRCGRLARWCAQVASLPQGRRSTTTRDPTRTHRTIRPRTPVLPCTGGRDAPTTLLTCGRARK